MKKYLLAVYMVAALLAAKSTQAQSTLIHYWNFNSYTQGAMYTPTITPVTADYSRIASPKAGILYTGLTGTVGNYDSYVDTLTATTTDHDTVNLRMGAMDGLMLRARNNSDSMQLLFYIPTTHYTNIALKYGTESSSVTSGMLHQIFAYSVDSGTTWITSGTGLSAWADSAWADSFSLVSVHFNDTKASNNAKLVFRITFSGNTHTMGAKGNNRFDNITVEGDTTTAYLGVATAAAGNSYTLSPNPVTNILNISSATDGAKQVTIYNTAGQAVYTSTERNRQIAINTANLATGNYIVSIRDEVSGMSNTMRFVKQ